MSSRNTVDVVMAAAPQERVIFLAATKAEGNDEARALGFEPVAVVTPRSLDAARGITADRIEASAALSPEQREELMSHATPSVATAPADEA